MIDDRADELMRLTETVFESFEDALGEAQHFADTYREPMVVCNEGDSYGVDDYSPGRTYDDPNPRIVFPAR